MNTASDRPSANGPLYDTSQFYGNLHEAAPHIPPSVQAPLNGAHYINGNSPQRYTNHRPNQPSMMTDAGGSMAVAGNSSGVPFNPGNNMNYYS